MDQGYFGAGSSESKLHAGNVADKISDIVFGASSWSTAAHDLWRTADSLIATFTGITLSVNCGAVFLRSDLPHTNGLDMLEFAIWGHFIVEVPSAESLDAVTARFWDDGLV